MDLRQSVRHQATLSSRKSGGSSLVPLHRELKKGTLIGILKQAGIEVEEFKKGSR